MTILRNYNKYEFNTENTQNGMKIAKHLLKC
ncbi:hypothetical protein SASC598P14_005790 [Snodgrassella alvi SCGC AB-598-P14]|nr:hypothetical protein SASC598P14_005790 [Snodgrassella alvi SCGC AB-598-P14]